MKECDILEGMVYWALTSHWTQYRSFRVIWAVMCTSHFRGSQRTLTSPTYFQGVRTPPHVFVYCRISFVISTEMMHVVTFSFCHFTQYKTNSKQQETLTGGLSKLFRVDSLLMTTTKLVWSLISCIWDKEPAGRICHGLPSACKKTGLFETFSLFRSLRAPPEAVYSHRCHLP